MPEAAPPAPAPVVSLHLLGRDYRIACSPSEQEKLQAAASLLEQHVQTTCATGRLSAPDNILMQAALNLALTALEERHLREQQAKVTRLKLSKLYHKLDRAICTPGRDMV